MPRRNTERKANTMKELLHGLYDAGKPVLIDGIWHVQWSGPNKTHITPFGWKERDMAEDYIATLLNVYAVRKGKTS